MPFVLRKRRLDLESCVERGRAASPRFSATVSAREGDPKVAERQWRDKQDAELKPVKAPESET